MRFERTYSHKQVLVLVNKRFKRCEVTLCRPAPLVLSLQMPYVNLARRNVWNSRAQFSYKHCRCTYSCCYRMEIDFFLCSCPNIAIMLTTPAAAFQDHLQYHVNMLQYVFSKVRISRTSFKSICSFHTTSSTMYQSMKLELL